MDDGRRAGSVLRFSVATLATGVAAGVAGTLLTLLLHAVQHLLFGYTENTFLVGVEHAPPARRVLALALGGVVVGPGWWWHRRRVARDRVSVKSALDRDDPSMPVGHTGIDAVLQIVAVGAGASLGREGAPRQVGAALASWLAARLGLDVARRRTLVACGAGAGLAAVYNVPLGGAAFTLEILLASVALIDVVPAVLTAAVATAVAWPVLGDRSTYVIPTAHLDASVLVWSVLLGPVAGLVGVAFVRSMERAASHAPRGWRVAVTVPVAFTVLGVASIGCPELLGNGKGPAGLAFDGTLALGAAVALVVLKPLATALMVGSGAVGGLLTPALATGAVLGVCTGRLWTEVWPGASLSGYAIVGAAAVLAVTQRAPLTAMILTLEFVGTGQAVLVAMLVAVLLAVATAWAVDRRLRPIALVRGAGRERHDPVAADDD